MGGIYRRLSHHAYFTKHGCALRIAHLRAGKWGCAMGHWLHLLVSKMTAPPLAIARMNRRHRRLRLTRISHDGTAAPRVHRIYEQIFKSDCSTHSSPDPPISFRRLSAPRYAPPRQVRWARNHRRRPHLPSPSTASSSLFQFQTRDGARLGLQYALDERGGRRRKRAGEPDSCVDKPGVVPQPAQLSSHSRCYIRVRDVRTVPGEQACVRIALPRERQ
ncbi:hypothetical protein BC826DRAFT_147255 [Russula brevipes]|nr:hypothetical protein BC826DRAFT_147255 [Russula brevipes]